MMGAYSICFTALGALGVTPPFEDFKPLQIIKMLMNVSQHEVVEDLCGNEHVVQMMHLFLAPAVGINKSSLHKLSIL